MLKIILTIIHRECLLIWRCPVEWCTPLLFFILVVLLFPLTVVPDIKTLQLVGPGILWLALLLATLLSLSKLFQADYEDGSLEQWLLRPWPLSAFVLAKLIAHWLMIFVPVILIIPLLAMMYHLNFHVSLILILTLLTGTPSLILLGSIGAALIVSLRQSSLLLALIILPLYVPTLIFATSAITSAVAGFSATASIIWLTALFSFSVILAPWVSAATLKIGIAYQ